MKNPEKENKNKLNPLSTLVNNASWLNGKGHWQNPMSISDKKMISKTRIVGHLHTHIHMHIII